MGSKPGRESTARARELGTELREARVRAGLGGADLARVLEWSPSKVSRMETGTRTVSELDVALYLSSCGVARSELERVLDLVRDGDDGYWLRPHGEQLPDELRSLIVQESTAGAITSYEPLLIPGLLQTEDYARALFRWVGGIPEVDVELRVRARMARQSLLRRRVPPSFTFFIHEHALRAVAGGATVMHEQLLHLVLASARPHCAIRVLLANAGPHGALGGAFCLMTHPDHPAVAYVENHTASLFVEDREQVAAHRLILNRLAGMALDGRQSQEWLAARASEHDRAEAGPRWPHNERASSTGGKVVTAAPEQATVLRSW